MPIAPLLPYAAEPGFRITARHVRWGLVWLAVSIGLSLLTLPLTIVQLQTLFGFGARPIRLDYVVYLWALVPWLSRRPDPFDFLRASTWRRWFASARGRLSRPATGA